MDPLSTAIGAAAGVAAVAVAAAARAIYRGQRAQPDPEYADLGGDFTDPTRFPIPPDSKPDEPREPTQTPERTVVLTFLAAPPAAPAGHAPWHPIRHLAQLEGRRADGLVLIHTPDQLGEAERLRDDLEETHGTAVRLWPVDITDAHDFGQVYPALRQLADEYGFETGVESYLVHASAGTPTMQSCLALMAQRQQLPAQLLWTQPPWESTTTHRVHAADLSAHDAAWATTRIEADEVDLDPLLRSANPVMRDLLAKLELRARLTVPLIFLGETGTGKSALSVLAHRVKVEHQGLKGPLVHGNCSQLRGDLARSMLFGHKRGAFTGAVADQRGWLMEADGGTLFLDEISHMRLEEQALLLCVLDDHQVMPVGASKAVMSHFQLIVATHRDLEEEVLAGRFAEDLWARFGPAVFRLPALRERTEDMGPTLKLALRKSSALIMRHLSMTPDAASTFLAFATSSEARWPANFREYFGAVLEMAMDVQTTGLITVKEVRAQIAKLRIRWSKGGLVVRSHAALDAELPTRLRRIDYLDKIIVVEMIRACRAASNVAAAGRFLFDISSLELKRDSAAGDRLRKALQKYGLTFDQIKAGHIE